MNDFSYLPQELWLHILTFLPIHVLKVVVMVSRRWREKSLEIAETDAKYIAAAHSHILTGSQVGEA